MNEGEKSEQQNLCLGPPTKVFSSVNAHGKKEKHEAGKKVAVTTTTTVATNKEYSSLLGSRWMDEAGTGRVIREHQHAKVGHNR